MFTDVECKMCAIGKSHVINDIDIYIYIHTYKREFLLCLLLSFLLLLMIYSHWSDFVNLECNSRTHHKRCSFIQIVLLFYMIDYVTSFDSLSICIF